MKDYNTLTFYKKVGCGSIYCIFMEDEGVFYRLVIRGDMTKETPCGEVWFNSISRILTYALRRGLWEDTAEDGIVKQLCQKTDKCYGYVPNEEHILHCADAIGRCVNEYVKARGFTIAKT